MQQKILQTAFALFHRNGIKSVSMDDISRQMGISKKTLYKWFSNKDELVFDMFSNRLQAIEGTCCAYKSQARNAIHELFLLMDMTREVFTNMHPSIFYDLQKYHAKTWELWMAHKREFILDQIQKNIRRGIEEKLYYPHLDVEILSRLRLAQLDIAFNADVFPPLKFRIEEVQLACLEHFMLGMATIKGLRLINRYKNTLENNESISDEINK